MGTKHICNHDDVIVTYLHPHGDIPGVRVRDLKASDSRYTRPGMALADPRCALCGVHLRKNDLRQRIARGGDLYDGRFRWVWRHSLEEWDHAERAFVEWRQTGQTDLRCLRCGGQLQFDDRGSGYKIWCQSCDFEGTCRGI